MYIRKTEDTWELQANYGYGDGWECLTAECTRKEAISQKQCYRDNGDFAPMRVKLVREPIVDAHLFNHHGMDSI